MTHSREKSFNIGRQSESPPIIFSRLLMLRLGLSIIVIKIKYLNQKILIRIFLNLNQMILSCDVKQIESFDSDLKISKSKSNDFVM